MAEEVKELPECRTMDYHTGVKVSPMEIRKWHFQVLEAIKGGASQYAISSGNSRVQGYRWNYDNSIVIQEFVNGYYQYTYPNAYEDGTSNEFKTIDDFGKFLIDENVRTVDGKFEIDSGIERTYSPIELFQLFLDHKAKEK